MKLLKNTRHTKATINVLGVYYYQNSYIWCGAQYNYATGQHTGYLSMVVKKLCN